jgi:hypothetical protein
LIGLPGGESCVVARHEQRTKEERPMDVASLAELLHETADHHDPYEKTHSAHNWWDWYASYLSARQEGSTPEQASEGAGLYMEDVFDVAPLSQ